MPIHLPYVVSLMIQLISIMNMIGVAGNPAFLQLAAQMLLTAVFSVPLITVIEKKNFLFSIQSSNYKP